MLTVGDNVLVAQLSAKLANGADDVGSLVEAAVYVCAADASQGRGGDGQGGHEGGEEFHGVFVVCENEGGCVVGFEQQPG